MGWGVAFFDADLDGWLDLFLANGHIYPNVDEFPALSETFRQKNQLLLGKAGKFRDVSDSAGPGLAVRRGEPRPGRRATSTATATRTSWSATWTTCPTVLENRQKTGPPLGDLPAREEGQEPLLRSARGSPSKAAGGARSARSAPGAATSRRATCAPTFGLGAYAGPVDVEVKMPGGARWRFTGLAVDRLHVLTLKDEERISPDPRPARPPRD